MKHILENDNLRMVESRKVQVHGLQSQPDLNGKTGPLDVLRCEPKGFR